MARPRVQWAAAVLVAVATVVAFSYMFDGMDLEAEDGGQHSGRVLAAVQQLQEELPQRKINWKRANNIAGLILSVLVSLTSSVDRECGAALYLVLFAVLLRLRKYLAQQQQHGPRLHAEYMLPAKLAVGRHSGL
ncbi:hypothetical protein COO60DRAFT_211258 [Scenedesmus sp. NREL 46B-D3]|nr:hypothetical protein COO60DRAFT_211258 [Scenedesmus sp. NREL 46B-D3]